MPDRPPLSAEDAVAFKALILPDMELCVYRAVDTAMERRVDPLAADVAKLKRKRWYVNAIISGVSAALTLVGLEIKGK